MIVKLLTEHHLKFLSLKGGCTGSSEYTLVKMPHCWKSNVMAHIAWPLNMNINESIQPPGVCKMSINYSTLHFVQFREYIIEFMK